MSGDFLIKHYTESIFTGAFVLTIGIVFGGFENNDIPSADAHQNEIIRFQAASVPLQTIEVKKTYKKNEQLSPKELKDILYGVGFRGERLREAWGTAMKESTGRPRSHNNNRETGDDSYGLFQINMIDSLGPARLKQFNLESNKDLFNPVRNAEIAFFMSNGGKNWSAWNGITENTLKWMSQYPTS
jgi:hypothetical protein